VALVLGLLLTACASTGSYPRDVFTEMHYQQSYRSQEPPRLAPPRDSVPVTGREIVYTFDEYKTLQVPAAVAAGYDPARASKLYRVNCALCHGAQGKGDGPMRAFLTGFPPADLTGPASQTSTEGELFGFINYGGRIGFAAAQRGIESPSPMPAFSKLLTAEERWLLVLFIKSLAGQP